MDNYTVPDVNVYVILITCEGGIQVRFKTTGDIASNIIKRMQRPRFLRRVFKMKTAEGSAVLIDLARAVSVDINKFADMTDDVPNSNA